MVLALVRENLKIVQIALLELRDMNLIPLNSESIRVRFLKNYNSTSIGLSFLMVKNRSFNSCGA